jgi:hypothetical protein
MKDCKQEPSLKQEEVFVHSGHSVKMKENQKKAFDFAADTTKQLITISTAIITLTVSFSKDILGGAADSTKIFLIWTWAIFIASIIFGLATLMALTGRLLPMKKSAPTQSVATNAPTAVTPAPSSPQLSTPNANQPATGNDPDDEIHINHGNIRFFSIAQVLLFSASIIMTGIFGYKSLSTPRDKHKNAYPVVRKATLNRDTTQYIDTLYLEKSDK